MLLPSLDRLCSQLTRLRPGACHTLGPFETAELAERGLKRLSVSLQERTARGYFGRDVAFTVELRQLFKQSRGMGCAGELGPYGLVISRVDTRPRPRLSFQNWQAVQRMEHGGT